MVLSSAWVWRVATASADLCQHVACNPERLSSDEVLDLLCFLPLHHLRRLALCLFSFFCLPITLPPDHPYYAHYHYSTTSSSSSDSSDGSDDDDSHSD